MKIKRRNKKVLMAIRKTNRKKKLKSSRILWNLIGLNVKSQKNKKNKKMNQSDDKERKTKNE